LLPHLAGVAVERVDCRPDLVDLRVHARQEAGVCARCGGVATRVHSRYERTLADAPMAGRRVSIRLHVRRFFCPTTDCPIRTFVEQVEGLTTRHARRTPLLRGMLEAIGLALVGRAGARMAAQLGAQVSRDTLLRLVRALPDPPPRPLTVVGVDDFALRRGHVYGTVLVDIVTRRPVDLLGDREADTLADWLRQHPGVEVICRDRSGAYAEGARVGAPDAVQVADRWHLWHNLAEAVEKTVIAHRDDLTEPEPNADLADPPVPAPPTPSSDSTSADRASAGSTPVESRLMTRTRERYVAVQQLLREGMSLSAICRTLRLDRKTVQRFARAETVDELLAKARNRGSLLDRFKPYLHERFNAGCTDAARLTEEITAMGYRGSDKTVRRYLHPFRATLTAPPARPVPPTVRTVTSWLTGRPEDLTESQTLRLKNILARSPTLQATYDLVRGFAIILTQRNGHELSAWMSHVEQAGSAALRSFVAGLRTDLDAVTAGLTLPYSSGPVEGTVNRIKMLKRQTYGRARLDLLRKRVLLT
jgi:transposase